MSGRLKDQVVVVTGGAAGIGLSAVEIAGREGALVAQLDIAPMAEPPDRSRRLVLQADVSDEQSVQAAIAATIDTFGRVDVLINAAGRDASFEPATMSGSEWDEVFAIDLKGAWICSKHVLESMVANGRGSIINVASLHGLMTVKGAFPYGAAKAGLLGLTRSLALEVGPSGIRVNSVTPGWTRSARVDDWIREESKSRGGRQSFASRIDRTQALGRIAEPSEIAEVICFLASDAASFVTGANWVVDGGLSARFAGPLGEDETNMESS